MRKWYKYVIGLLIIMGLATFSFERNSLPMNRRAKVITVSSLESGSFELIEKPLICTEYKKRLMGEYSLKHYGKEMEQIEPRAVIIHWTASDSAKSTFKWFNREDYKYEPGTLNVGSQFIVDQDGSIYRLMSETTLARHAIGYNWCAIGIENVDGVNHQENLTKAQLAANVKLIKCLQAKYPTIRYVWGHYQQEKAKKFGLYRELVAKGFNDKQDPGPSFMQQLREKLHGDKVEVLY